MAGWRLGAEKENSYQEKSKAAEQQSGTKEYYEVDENRRKREKENVPEFTVTAPVYRFDELILSDKVHSELMTVINASACWNKVFKTWGLETVLKDKQNLLVNLYGESGTGKTMGAHAIANALHKGIICVNYADIESKYVGETGKNLTALFKFAQSKDAIIFFDEADALLSKRVTNMSSATDVSVNQTRSVLLTLMNSYKGMIIFASNFISNYDTAFMRRIQYHIKFELPNKELRKKLWRKYIPGAMPNDADIEILSEKYDGISGSDIANAVLRASLSAAANNCAYVSHKLFEEETENILKAKKANAGSEKVTVTQREVSEEYAIKQLSGQTQLPDAK